MNKKAGERPAIPVEKGGFFVKTSNGGNLYVYDVKPSGNYGATIYLISGITGINHHAEREIIEQLSNKKHRVVVIHPRGTGYSEGSRGALRNFSDFITDHVEIIRNDADYSSKQHKILLFGHSMSTAIVLKVADIIGDVDGVMLINPPYLLKKAKGMSPGFGQYLKYAWFYLFERHKPIVNMAGDPAIIENEEDRKESESRSNDPLLVKYFSMYMMLEARKTMGAMLKLAEAANYPLLLMYGKEDCIVEKTGCDMIFNAWKCKDKQYELIEKGSHGRSTVIQAKEIIDAWIDRQDMGARK